MRALVVYGIKSCDTCRRARKFFDRKNIEYRFHDIRDDGLDMRTLKRWAKRIGWEKLLNKRSATWRKVPEADQSHVTEDKALAMMLDQPTLIKRPVIEARNYIAVGFSEQQFTQFLEKKA